MRAGSTLTASPKVPGRLAALGRVRETDATRTRRFELSGSSQINGRQMAVDRIDEVVAAGTTELWEIQNISGTAHNVHPHGVSFRVVEYAGRPALPHLTGWKDTVYVPPGETVRCLVRFGDEADPDTPYVFHCHILQQKDRGMMGQFVVVNPGQRTGDPAHEHGGDGS